jgi:CHASE1-domain containing sensor protein
MADLEQLTAIDEGYVLKQYEAKIKYYWDASRSNKESYKRYRTWTVILGAALTLISSIAAAEFIQSVTLLRVVFAVATPILAATMAVTSGLGQNFHWGATWRDMVLNATRLEMERDRFLATPTTRDCEKELAVLNGLVLEETKNFFQRILDSEIKESKPTAG